MIWMAMITDQFVDLGVKKRRGIKMCCTNFVTLCREHRIVSLDLMSSSILAMKSCSDENYVSEISDEMKSRDIREPLPC